MAETNSKLSNEGAKAVEAGLARHFALQAELDQARREITDLREKLKLAETDNEHLRSWHNHVESRLESAIADRDAAIAGRAVYEVLFSSLLAQMREFKIPHVPLITNGTERVTQ